jgi:hypothetical protein
MCLRMRIRNKIDRPEKLNAHTHAIHTRATMVMLMVCRMVWYLPLLRIRIRRIHMFLGLLDPWPAPLVRGMDPDPSIIKQKLKKNFDSYCLVTSFDFDL